MLRSRHQASGVRRQVSRKAWILVPLPGGVRGGFKKTLNNILSKILNNSNLYLINKLQ
jgi:hypothetical protein